MRSSKDSMPDDAPSPRPSGIVVLATLAVVAALHLGRVFLVPIALAILFTGLLRPLVRRFERAGLSAPVGATTVLVVLLGVLATGGILMADPVRQWASEAPQTIAAAQERLQSLRRPMKSITDAASKLEHAGEEPGPGGRAPAPAGSGASGASAGGGPSVATIAARVFGTTTSLIGGLVEVVLLTLLLLASGDEFLKKLVKVVPLRRDKVEAVRIAQETETVVAHYMVATALINVGQGALVGLAMWLLHLPNPVLWGMLTFLLEFIPFLGGACMLILLTLAGLATADGVGRALMGPAVYLTISTLQNNLVSPIAYGRRLRLNPVAVLVGVLFWYYLWGVAGAFLAVPIIATLKILGDHIERLSPVAEFLGD
ncbi:MAG TPA: AI-2E family transporter [Gemmatimonadales bacterium]|nr:AI-2E family transporter [Gemmatimonadales bacterium]